MTDISHPKFAALVELYRRDLRHTDSSDDLDARIDALVAGRFSRRTTQRTLARRGVWLAALGVTVLAICAGVLLGMWLERGARPVPMAQRPATPTADLALWPRDSVALQIPVEYSRGKFVALGPRGTASGERYWIYVVVSNDGTVRIDRIVAADPESPSHGSHDGITLQTP